MEETLCSVLDQGYPQLEYLVMDGGSTDASAEVLRRYGDRLAYWCSEPDGGQYDAINKGFARSTGEVMGWLNSDDKHTPWTLSIVAEIFETFPEIEWLTTQFPLRWDARGRAVRCSRRDGFSRAAYMAGENLPTGAWYAPGWLQQESTFWRRSLWERAGGKIDTRVEDRRGLRIMAALLPARRAVCGRHAAGGLSPARRSKDEPAQK